MTSTSTQPCACGPALDGVHEAPPDAGPTAAGVDAEGDDAGEGSRPLEGGDAVDRGEARGGAVGLGDQHLALGLGRPRQQPC